MPHVEVIHLWQCVQGTICLIHFVHASGRPTPHVKSGTHLRGSQDQLVPSPPRTSLSRSNLLEQHRFLSRTIIIFFPRGGPPFLMHHQNDWCFLCFARQILYPLYIPQGEIYCTYSLGGADSLPRGARYYHRGS